MAAASAHGDVAGLLQKHGYGAVKVVGEGSFGKAILVQSTDGSRLICKMVDVSKATPKEMQDAIKESRVLADLKHPYIVRYRESFTERGWLSILMDYCEGGDLTAQIEKAKKMRKPIAEDQVLRWFTQAILALKYIHEKHILHRDLKPQNFFLAKNRNLKMGDFGIAKVLACTIAVARTQIGTPYYLSPELCQDKPYTWPSDIWSMGCILYELCAMKVPFDAKSMPGLVQRIIRDPSPTIPGGYSGFVRQLCSELLAKDPNGRPSPENMLQRPQMQAIVKQLLAEAQAASSGPQGAQPEPGGPVVGPHSETAGTFQKDDLVEFYSNNHGDWLAAMVLEADESGRIKLDLKPNTWISPSEQASRVRPRRRGGTGQSAGGRAGSKPMPSPPRQGSAATPGRQRSASPGGRTPGRMPSPRRGGGSRASSPGPRGSPNGRPPGIPPSRARPADSPLLQGGRGIVGR